MMSGLSHRGTKYWSLSKTSGKLLTLVIGVLVGLSADFLDMNISDFFVFHCRLH